MIVQMIADLRREIVHREVSHATHFMLKRELKKFGQGGKKLV